MKRTMTDKQIIDGDYGTQLLKCAVRARDPRYGGIGGMSDSGPVLEALRRQGLIMTAYDYDKQIGVPPSCWRINGWVASDKGVVYLFKKHHGIKETK